MFADYNWYQLAWYFLSYAFLGWCMEVVFCSISQGHVTNRGFLNGPVCPIYGFGMLAILVLLRPFLAVNDLPHNIGLFFCGMVLASAVEYLVGWGMLKLFHARWWDYRDKPCNLNGFICLPISLCWGLGTLVACRVLHPLVHTLTIRLLPHGAGLWVLALLGGLFVIDTVVSVRTAIHLDRDLSELDRIARHMEAFSEKMSTDLGSRALETDQYLDNARLQAKLAGYELRDAVEDAADQLEDAAAARKAQLEDAASARRAVLVKRQQELHARLTRAHSGTRRLLRAFPHLDADTRQAALQQLQKELRDRR